MDTNRAGPPLNSTQPARPVGDGDGQPANQTQTAQDTGAAGHGLPEIALVNS